jgi:acetyltransferase-like isoleucine patch superfamily enzyme
MSRIDQAVTALRDPITAQGYVRRARDLVLSRWLARGFGSFGRGAILYQPVWILGPATTIHLGPGAVIGPSTRIGAFDSELRIGGGTDIVGGASLFATGAGIEIGREVLMAWNVQIYDHQHRFDDPTASVLSQGFDKRARVTVGDGAHLGANVYVGPGVTVGRNAVVGANAVVVADVPDYAIAAGIPARIIGDVRAQPAAAR